MLSIHCVQDLSLSFSFSPFEDLPEDGFLILIEDGVDSWIDLNELVDFVTMEGQGCFVLKLNNEDGHPLKVIFLLFYFGHLVPPSSSFLGSGQYKDGKHYPEKNNKHHFPPFKQRDHPGNRTPG